MKWYRIVDSWWEPYCSWYNATELRDVAEAIEGLADWDWALEEAERYSADYIYRRLLDWERDFIFIVEESDTPFMSEWYDCNFDGCDCHDNFSDRAIISYAEFNYWKEFDEDKLVDYIWGLWDINTDEFIKWVRDFFLNNKILKQWNFYYIN